tara:strand:- start:549 stop:890 length:342 start_codon:yes stop_codon:yes gene_type:complete
MAWNIKDITPSVNWVIKKVGSISTWQQRIVNMIRWNLNTSEYWNDMNTVWETYADYGDMQKKAVNAMQERDLEWANSPALWNNVDVKWNIAGTESWVLKTKNISTWARKSIVD